MRSLKFCLIITWDQVFLVILFPIIVYIYFVHLLKRCFLVSLKFVHILDILCYISYKCFLQPFCLLFCCIDFFTLIDSNVLKFSFGTSQVRELCLQSSDVQFLLFFPQLQINGYLMTTDLLKWYFSTLEDFSHQPTAVPWGSVYFWLKWMFFLLYQQGLNGYKKYYNLILLAGSQFLALWTMPPSSESLIIRSSSAYIDWLVISLCGVVVFSL